MPLGRVKSSALVRVQRITTAAEACAEGILRRTLMGTGWTVALKLPIQVVLNKETTRLTEAEFSLYTRGHFDFTVYDEEEHEPAFVVEFDAFGHDKPRQIERDIIKNRLCAAGDLPLVRIGLEDVGPKEQVSVLEWIIELLLALDQDLEAEDEVSEPNDIRSAEASGQASDPAALLQLAYDAAARLSSEGMQTLWPIGRDGKPRVPEMLTVDVRAGRVWFTGGSSEPVPGDEGGAFEREHPFGANAVIARRLLDDFGISVGNEVEGFASSWAAAPYRFEIAWPGRQPMPFESGRISEFVISERDFRVTARNRPAQPLLTSAGRARFAWAHRIETLPLGPGTSPTSMPPGFAAIRLWFDPWGAATELALYDALSQVERWANGSLARST